MRLISGTVAFVALLTASSGLLLAPADAATYTSSGVRCTEVGTSGSDVLVGTSSRDVLCGLGGDDTIKGLGGNDLIDAGLGSDEVLAGDGADRVLGGAGADDVAGGAGADDLFGGAGGDEIAGGGSGDLLGGQDGNDDLVGGQGPDDVRGGPGTNWCTIDSADTRTRCVYDREPAALGNATLDKDTVDVSSSSQPFTIRIHVTDDTGVTEVSASLISDTNGVAGGGDARLVSGTVRDGVWVVDSMVGRWTAPGTYYIDASVRDRVGRWSSRSYPEQTLTVKDRNPDTDPPQTTLREPGTDASVDVRQSRQDVVIRARVTDDVSGVWYVSMCLLKPQDGYYTNLPCENADLVSGDLHDGVWKAVITIPRGATGGDWNVEADAVDNAGAEIRYMGPDAYRYWTDDGANPDPNLAPFPGGLGRFPVVGSNDSTPASIEDVTLSPSSVDTLPGDATVTIRVHAVDAPAEGVTGVGAALAGNPDGSSDGTAPGFAPIDLTLVDGTPVDGHWEGTFLLPQGTPPGSYYVQAWVEDPGHWRSYVAEPSDASSQKVPGDSTVTVVDSTP